MIYELRTYTAMPGRLPELNTRFRETTTKIWERMGWHMVGFWTYKHGGASDWRWRKDGSREILRGEGAWLSRSRPRSTSRPRDSR